MLEAVRRCRTLAAAVLTLAACGGGEKAPDGARQPTDAEQLDALRALPYLDASPKAVAPGERDGTLVLDSSRASPGYSLYTLLSSCTAELVDLRGRTVHRWYLKRCKGWHQVELLPDGTLLAVGSERRAKRALWRLSWGGDVLLNVRLPAHHDIELTPSGRLLTLTLERRKARFLGREHEIRDDYLTLLDENGATLEKISLFALFQPEREAGPFRMTNARFQGALDLFHTNSIEWMNRPELFGTSPFYDRDFVLISVRHQDQVAIVDWRRKRLVWWWGRGELSGPHDASLLANGHVLIFDNGLGRGWSRVVEVDPASRQIVWQFRADPPESFHSSALGGAQRLPNGNTLIASSESGEAFEVTAAGEVVWKFATPHKNEKGQRRTFVRMKRYEPELVDPLLASGR
jgi:hypothetical protein